MSEIKLNIIEGIYVEKPKEWVLHSRSKNYIAKIKGLDKQYGFKREFLEKVKVGKYTYFLLDDFKEGEVYEIKCIYYTRSGHAHAYLDGFFIVERITESEIILKSIDEKEIIEIIKEKYNNTIEEVNIEKQIDEVKTEIEKIQTEINEKKILLIELQEIKKKLQEENDRIQINTDEVKNIKDNLINKIKEIASRIVRTGEKNDYGYKISIKFDDGHEVKIKENGQINYIYVDGAYIISEYKNTEWGISTLYRAYKILKDLEEKRYNQIEEIKKEVM